MGRRVPIYPKLGDFRSKRLREIVHELLARLPDRAIEETLPKDLRARHKLVARSEALARNQSVIICAKSNASNSCDASQFWNEYATEIFVDVDGSDSWTTGDILLKTLPAMDIMGTETAFTRQTSATFIKFGAVGLASTTHRFDIHAVSTDSAYETKYGRTLCISKPGRIRVIAFTAGTCSAF